MLSISTKNYKLYHAHHLNDLLYPVLPGAAPGSLPQPSPLSEDLQQHGPRYNIVKHHLHVCFTCHYTGQPQDKFSTLARVERIPLGKGGTDPSHTSTLKRVKFVDQEMVREREQ